MLLCVSGTQCCCFVPAISGTGEPQLHSGGQWWLLAVSYQHLETTAPLGMGPVSRLCLPGACGMRMYILGGCGIPCCR